MPRRDALLRTTRRPVGRAGLVLESGLLLAALAVLAGGYVSLVSGTWWWVTTVSLAAVVLVTSGVLRQLGVPGAPVGGLVAGVVVLGWVCAPDSLVLGVVPTPETLRTLVEVLDRAGTVVAEEAPPVAATAPITLLVAGTFGLVALVGDVLLRRRGGVPLIGLLLVVIYLVPAIVLEEVPSFVVLAVPAALWLVLLHRSASSAGVQGRGRQESTVQGRGRQSTQLVSTAGALMGVGAVVLAFALVPVLPDTTALTGTADDFDAGPFERGINPMLTLGDDLRSPSRAVALEYTTDGDPAYLSVAMLRDFTGDSWEPVAREDRSPDEGRPDLDGIVEVERQVVEVEIRDLRSSLLPVPYPAVDVRGLTGDWDRVEAGLTYRSTSDDTRDQTYSVTSLAREPTQMLLAGASEAVDPRRDAYLELPSDVPAVVAETAELVAGNVVGAYAKAQALEDFFRSGAFEYSETAPVDGDYDGNGVSVIERFLEERSGYCVHFSSAMAVMARSLGVPARIMVGYAPGERVRPAPGADEVAERYRVMTDDLHAWPQIYVAGVGWVEFEPTPGIADGEPTPQDPGATNAAPGPSVSAPLPEPTVAEPTPEASDETAVTSQAGGENGGLGRVAGVVVLAILVLLTVPTLGRAGLRRYRLRRSATSDDWWREVVATADDLGLHTDATTTVGAHAVELSRHVHPETQPALERLRSGLERRRYGPRRVAVLEQDTVRDDAVAVVGDLLALAPAGRRRRARFLPRSLLRRR